MKIFYRINLVVALIGILAIASNAQLRAPENVPIAFYGKVIDQSGQPVAGAKVTFDFIISLMSQNRTETTLMVLQTDHDGIFALTNVTGYGIDKLVIEKTGFIPSRKGSRSYVFGLDPDYKPNPDTPEIFKMWKASGKEPLLAQSWHGKLACDGTTNRFDLFRGARSKDGSLVIICTRTPLDFQITSRQPFDYKLEIAITGGGIQPTDDEFTYLAPHTGYKANLTIDRKPGDPKWGGGLKQEFYIKTATGESGRLFIEWDAGHRPSPTPFKWECSINPAGSRNLER